MAALPTLPSCLLAKFLCLSGAAQTATPRGDVKQKALIGGMAHNIAKNLNSGHAERLEALGNVFIDYRVIIYENDSTDKTPQLLQAWASRNPRVSVKTEVLGKSTKGISSPSQRWIRLRVYFDKMLEMRDPRYDFEYFFFVMMDSPHIAPPPLDIFNPSFINTWESMCASAEIEYRNQFRALLYDTPALRDETYPEFFSEFYTTRRPWNPRIFPGLVLQLHMKRRIIETANEQNWTYGLGRSLLVPVNSCSNGLSIHKRRFMDGCVTSGTKDSDNDVEIAVFQNCIRANGGRVYFNAEWRIPPPPITQSSVPGSDEENPMPGIPRPKLIKDHIPFEITPALLRSLFAGKLTMGQPPKTRVRVPFQRWVLALDCWQLISLRAKDFQNRGLNHAQAVWLEERVDDVRQLLVLAGWKIDKAALGLSTHASDQLAKTEKKGEVFLTGNLNLDDVDHTVVVYKGQSAAKAAQDFAAENELEPFQQRQLEGLVSGWIQAHTKKLQQAGEL